MSSAAPSTLSRLRWPVPIYVAAAAVGAGLQWTWPSPWIGSPLADILLMIGLIMIVAALALVAGAFSTMRRHRTTVLPDQQAAHLVTNGAFALSRNPMYLGFTLLLLGAALAFGTLWLILAGVIAALTVQQLAIIPEERALDLRFGKRYRDYSRKVRRWF